MTSWWRSLGHDTRVFLLAIFSGLPGVAVSMGFLWFGGFTAEVQWTASVAILGTWVGLAVVLREHVVRPLGTLANMLAATDQSRTLGFVTQGPKRIFFVCSMHMAMGA